MAEKILHTKIALKIKTLQDWTDNYADYEPLRGEVCLCEIPSAATSPLASPAPLVLFKVGDGEHTFAQLDWVSAKAADVYSWAKKTEADFTAWVKTLVTVSDIDLSAYYKKTKVDELLAANSAADQEYAKNYADGLAKNYDAAGAAAAVQSNLDEYEASNNAAVAAAAEKGQQGIDDAAAALAEAQKKTTMAAVEAKNYATKTEAQGYADAKDEAIAAAQKAGDDAAAALEAYKTAAGQEHTAIRTAFANADATTLQSAKDYADGLLEGAELGQYTTEQEVKNIVDEVIAGAVDGDTITGLANLVEYLHTHGAEAAEMGAAIDVLEGKVGTIEGKPAYNITSTQINNWDGEVGAKAIANENKAAIEAIQDLPGSGITADDIAAWNNEKGAKALAGTKTTTAEVKTQIEAYGYATESDLTLAEGRLDAIEEKPAYDILDSDIAKWNAAEQNAKDYADGLADNYATAAQGAKADTALQSVEVGTGLKVSAKANNKQMIDIDDAVIFILDCND